MTVKLLMHWQPKLGTALNSQILTEACQCAEDSLNAVKDGRWKSSLTFYRPMNREMSSMAGGQGGSSGDQVRDFLGLALHEQPNKYYFILRANKLIMEADSSIQTVMDKLQSYKARVVLNFEIVIPDFTNSDKLLTQIMDVLKATSNPITLLSSFLKIRGLGLADDTKIIYSDLDGNHGFQYKLGDFQLRVGKCVPNMSESLRGIMMEVEYLPLSSIEKSRQILEEFIDMWHDAISKKSLPGHFMHIESNFAEFGLGDTYTSQHTAVQYATCMAQLIAVVRQ